MAAGFRAEFMRRIGLGVSWFVGSCWTLGRTRVFAAGLTTQPRGTCLRQPFNACRSSPAHQDVRVDEPQVTPDDIERAAERTAGLIRRTPVIGYDRLTLKLELLQHAGSFKPRGAANRVLAERETAGGLPAAGLVTASGGNHGAAVAYVTRAIGVHAEVFMPSTSPGIKRSNIIR